MAKWGGNNNNTLFDVALVLGRSTHDGLISRPDVGNILDEL
jgi:hypothetical protein